MTHKKLAEADNDDLIRQLKDDISGLFGFSSTHPFLEALNAGFPEVGGISNNPQSSSPNRANVNRRMIVSQTAPPTFDPSVVSLNIRNSHQDTKSEESRSLLDGSMEFTV